MVVVSGAICYADGESRGSCVNFPSNGALARIALAGVLLAALGLAGCGRKSSLDPPPDTRLAQPLPGQAPAPDTHFDDQGRPIAPPPRGKRPFFLDWLVD
jgi:predicted small lipoprotein YifL